MVVCVPTFKNIFLALLRGAIALIARSSYRSETGSESRCELESKSESGSDCKAHMDSRPGARVTKYLTIFAYDYCKFIVRSTYDSDITCAEISLRECRKLNYDTIFDDIMILHMNVTYEKLSIYCKMFCKLDVCRQLIVTLALS